MREKFEQRKKMKEQPRPKAPLASHIKKEFNFDQ